MKVAAQVWHENVQRQTGVVRPSRAYSGVWLRDSFWTLVGLGDTHVSYRALQRFARFQRPGGQVPTQFRTWIVDPLYYDDESTMLFLIWSDWQKLSHGPVPSAAALSKALHFVRGHVRNGAYVSKPGTYGSWFDSFRLQRADTLAYNQGIYATSLLAARDLGLHVGGPEEEAASRAYGALEAAKGHYLRMGARLDYHDISGLTGDFLATWLYHRPLLTDEVVRATLQTQPRFGSGFRVVTDAGGEYLPPRSFIGNVQTGEYQNGGSWLLFDYLALATGYLHGVQSAGVGMRNRLAEEFARKATFHEFLATNPRSTIFRSEPPIRDGFSWDTFVIAIDRVVTHGCPAPGGFG
jgi:hypothetical protein